LLYTTSSIFFKTKSKQAQIGECMAPMTKSKQASRPGPSRPRWGNCKMKSNSTSSCTYFCVAPMERRKKGVPSMLYTRDQFKVDIKRGHI
jgi:hypothetical protein